MKPTHHAALLVVVSALSLAACTQDAPKHAEPAPGPSRDALEIPAPGGRFALPSGRAGVPPVQVEVVARGNGLEAHGGARAAVHYTGTLRDGAEFDSSRGGKPFEFRVGAGQVIPGWDIVVARMRVGDRWKAHIPSALAYGHAGYPGAIPPDADLDFDMELVGVR